MDAQALDGHLVATFQIDSCGRCQVFWFDHLENVRLSPSSTLQVFELIGQGTPRTGLSSS